MKTLLILGPSSNAEVQLVYNKACECGHRAHIFNSQKIPDDISLDYSPNSGQCSIYIENKAIMIDTIHGVFWAEVMPPNTQQEHNIELAGAINYENTCLLQILLSHTNINWLNPFKAIQFHRVKPKQLNLAKQLGANIPATYLGNNHAQIADFLLLHPQCLVKAIYSGISPFLLGPEQHEMHRFCEWAKYPVTLQEFIPGDSVRTFIVGDFMVSALLQQKGYSTHASIRASNADENVKYIPMQIPIRIQQLAVRIMRAFHAQFIAIDWRLTPQGQFVFLEANPTPAFAGAQKQLKVKIDHAIVDLLSQ